MKILKHGNSLQQLICPICKCLFTYEDSDLITVWYERNFSPEKQKKGIRCPECCTHIWWQQDEELNYTLAEDNWWNNPSIDTYHICDYTQVTTPCDLTDFTYEIYTNTTS